VDYSRCDQNISVGPATTCGFADNVFWAFASNVNNELERHFATGEPMPLVLDDLLVQLDDTSARAALVILSEISRTTQVLFFTHHHHLLEMARDIVPADLLVEHQIGDESRSPLRGRLNLQAETGSTLNALDAPGGCGNPWPRWAESRAAHELARMPVPSTPV
jgi:hypothetical protein